MAHRTREKHKRAHPVHVVLRSRLRSLRSQFLFPTVRRALARANLVREDFRLLHFSVQADHVHLIIEADSQCALSRGMQGLAVRIARNVNPLLFRRGSLWSGRYYGRALTSPRAFKNALRYVLNNFRKHGEPVRGDRDPCSSSIYDLRRGAPEHLPISRPKTWLARAG
ncbi:MAG: transposase [Polyangiaceae bacterium]